MRIIILLLTILAFSGCRSINEEISNKEFPISAEAEMRYQSAEKEFADGRYNSAIRLLYQALPLTKNISQLEKISFLIAECRFSAGYLNKAHKLYQQFLIDYPKTSKLNDVIQRELEIGFKFMGGAKRSLWGLYIIPSYDYGVQIVRKTLKTYPYCEAAEKYHFQLAGHLFKIDYNEAIIEYESFIKIYSKSNLLPEAEYKLALSHLGLYQGYGYEVSPLAESHKITSKFSQKYPDSPFNDNIKQLQQQIDDLFAQRDYEIGSFYKRTGSLQSAKMYFESVIKNYPQTKWAKESQILLSQ